MANRWRPTTEADVEKRLARGFGQGEGADYTPWIRKHDISSSGRAREVPGVKIVGRSHHLLSDLEYRGFLSFERAPGIRDIREQFPLQDRDRVERLAQELGIRPPRYVGTDVRFVLTTDLLLSLDEPKPEDRLAIAIKPSSRLRKVRTLELLELERLYWEEEGVRWQLITDVDVDRITARNLHWLRGDALLERRLSDPKLHLAFLTVLAEVRWQACQLRHVLRAIADTLKIAEADSVALFKHHAWWGKFIEVDLSVRLSLCVALTLLTVTLPSSAEEEAA